LTKRLISISEFNNIAPTDTAYPTTYKVKVCTLCSNEATKIVLYDVDGIILQQRYCDKHIRGIKK
jgi:hypothetical protein